MQKTKIQPSTVCWGRKTVLVIFIQRCDYELHRFGLLLIMISEDLASHTAALMDCEQSLYQQVALRISELIEHGTLRPADPVPSVPLSPDQHNSPIPTTTPAHP